AAEIALPERVAHHRTRRAAAPIVLGGEEAPRFGADAERREVVAAHPQPARQPQLAAVREVEAGRSPGEDAGEALLTIADLLPQGTREIGAASTEIAGAAVGRSGDAHLGELARARHRQRAQAHGVQELEDRRVRADAERERENRDDGEAGVEAEQ